MSIIQSPTLMTAPTRRKKKPVLIDRVQARKILGVSREQFYILRRSPAFPDRIEGNGFDELFERREIKALKSRLDECEAKGWLVPEALYSWADTGEKEKPLRRLK